MRTETALSSPTRSSPEAPDSRRASENQVFKLPQRQYDRRRREQHSAADEYHVNRPKRFHLVEVALPIALIETGDTITIDAIKGQLSVDLSDEELAKRKEAWGGPRETIYSSGALWKYAQLVGETHKGAVTHPGASAERHVYMDL